VAGYRCRKKGSSQIGPTAIIVLSAGPVMGKWIIYILISLFSLAENGIGLKTQVAAAGPRLVQVPNLGLNLGGLGCLDCTYHCLFKMHNLHKTLSL